jgi:carboxypeptidase PM20D1
MFPGDEKRFHGINERISIKNYEQAINFYYHVIVNADQASLAVVHKKHFIMSCICVTYHKT